MDETSLGGANDFTRPYALKHSGTRFYYGDLDMNVLVPEDMAHCSAARARFSGDTREFYSVGQHEILASLLVPKQLALAALVHDEAENYAAGDIPSPFKAFLRQHNETFVIEYEQRVQAWIEQQLGLHLTVDDHKAIKHVDRRLVMTEARDLMPQLATYECWFDDSPYTWHIDPLPPPIVEEIWLNRFNQLTGRPLVI